MNNTSHNFERANPVVSNDWLDRIAREHYVPVEDPTGVDGAQMWAGQWWAPRWGCDTLDHLLTDISGAISQSNAEISEGCPVCGSQSLHLLNSHYVCNDCGSSFEDNEKQ